jgi:hypothetical protein
MKKDTNKIIGYFIVIDGVLFPSCTNDLNQAPESTNAIPGDQFY